jgi:hypothetical protein
VSPIDRFLAASQWRWGRMCAAWGLILTGAVLVGDVTGFIVTLFGFVPFAESLYDVNLVAPLLGRPLSAAILRARAAV